MERERRRMWMVMVVAVAVAVGAEAQQECVSKLVPCLDYINGTTVPSAECCDSIKETVETQLPCLCSVYNSPGLLSSFKVTLQQALNLTTNCRVPISLGQCSNSTSISPTRSPPAVPGAGDGSHSPRTAMPGAFTLLLLLSTLFY